MVVLKIGLFWDKLYLQFLTDISNTLLNIKISEDW